MGASTAANLIIHELLPRLKKSGLGVENSPVTPSEIAVLAMVKDAAIFSHHEIRQLLDKAFDRSD